MITDVILHENIRKFALSIIYYNIVTFKSVFLIYYLEFISQVNNTGSAGRRFRDRKVVNRDRLFPLSAHGHFR